MTHAFEGNTPWRYGPFRGRNHGLAFGTMYEDPSIELGALRPASRVFCIAAAGCTARSLAAAGHQVTAVDINPVQLAYAEARAAGAPPQAGAIERWMSRSRELGGLAGWSRRKLVDFLSLSEPAEQVEYWDQRLDTRLWRLALDTLLSPRLLRLCYSNPLVASLPRNFGERLRNRLRRGWARHSNRDNPYAAMLLLGTTPPEPPGEALAIKFVCAEAADFLERCAPASFDGFALSNIGDGAPYGYVQRLRAAVEHAASPGAVVVNRSFGEAGAKQADNWAAADRSLLWGVVEVNRIEGGLLCSTC